MKIFEDFLKPPGYHFVPPAGWMNDPNGLIHFNGEYHLFYQHNPDNPFGPALNRMRWGHAKSADLVRWRRLPIAMEPDMPYDRGGVWSGCAMEDGGRIFAFYTGVSGDIFRRQAQCIATSGGGLTAWDKYDGNPVIPRPPEGVPSWCFRDPYVWKHGDEWLMVLGASLRGRRAVLLYRSPDLFRWEYDQPLFVGDPRKHGRVWECPNFFPLGGRWVLIVSVIPWKVIYFTGSFDGRRFQPESEGVADHGSCLYAPQVFGDASGRRVMFGWLREGTPLAALSGRQGALSLPRIITAGAGGALRFEPAPEIETLRENTIGKSCVELTPRAPLVINEIESDSLEIEAEFENCGTADRFGLKIPLSGPLGGEVFIYYDERKRGLVVERPLASGKNLFAPLPMKDGEPLSLRIFIDRSIIEIFAGGRAGIAFRTYLPACPGAGLRFFTTAGRSTLRTLGVHCIKPAY